MRQPPFIIGEKVVLRALTTSDVSEAYLTWLNDHEVLQWRGPKAFPSVREDIESYVAGISGSNQLVLAVEDRATGSHVGNIALAHIQWVHRSAEINILIGEADGRGRGIGRDAIKTLTGHAFGSMGLHRVWAESPNPAFNRAVEALGWQKEGVKRQAFLKDGAFIDITCWAIFAADWQRFAKN